MKNKTVNKKDFRILSKISKKSGLSDFWIGGSTTYREAAMCMGFNFKNNDYDVAVIGGFGKYKNVLEILEKNGFTIIKNRPYYLKFHKAFQTMAVKENILLDIAIVTDISQLGHFNWESIFWHFPSGEIHDLYNAIDAMKSKKLLPIISVDKENPFILSSRFAKLCARFHIDFIKDKRLCKFAKDLSVQIATWDSKDYFHGKYAKGHGYFNTLQAIVISSGRTNFISNLMKVGIFQALFPEINKNIIYKPEVVKKIQKSKNVKDIVSAMEFSLRESSYSLKKFKKRLEVISDRLG